MEDKKLNRVFDRVKLSREREEAMLADLLREKKEVSSMKQKRRIPAAALVAAVLVAALAGTALAYMSRVTVASYENGYSVQAEIGNIPLSSLPEDVLQRAAASTDIADILAFQSWDEAEAYLNMEIADNDKLNHMQKNLYGMSLGENRQSVMAPCLIWLDYCESLPSRIQLKASYIEGGFRVNQGATLLVENPALEENRPYWLGKPSSELIDTEVYVTPNGIETTIVTSKTASGAHIKYEAQFVLEQAFFRVDVNADEGESGEETLAFLKEILDAYE